MWRRKNKWLFDTTWTMCFFSYSRTQWQMLKGKKLMISSRQDELGDEMLCPTYSTINTPEQAQPTCLIRSANWLVQVWVPCILTRHHGWMTNALLWISTHTVRKKERGPRRGERSTWKFNPFCNSVLVKRGITNPKSWICSFPRKRP